ncbi:hypothetical protein F5B21DRAFT_269833 [Xylaria acuta]|nr:hypothetical protein F5B21DRAFT_269833 [Xylaria acuta]
MCTSQPPGGSFNCLASYSLREDRLRDAFLNSSIALDDVYVNEMDKSLRVGHIFQTKIFYPLLAGSAGLFFLSVVSMLALKRFTESRVPKSQLKITRLRSILAVTLVYAFGLAIAAAFSASQAGGALHFATTALPGSLTRLRLWEVVPFKGFNGQSWLYWSWSNFRCQACSQELIRGIQHSIWACLHQGQILVDRYQ